MATVKFDRKKILRDVSGITFDAGDVQRDFLYNTGIGGNVKYQLCYHTDADPAKSGFYFYCPSTGNITKFRTMTGSVDSMADVIDRDIAAEEAAAKKDIAVQRYVREKAIDYWKTNKDIDILSRPGCALDPSDHPKRAALGGVDDATLVGMINDLVDVYDEYHAGGNALITAGKDVLVPYIVGECEIGLPTGGTHKGVILVVPAKDAVRGTHGDFDALRESNFKTIPSKDRKRLCKTKPVLIDLDAIPDENLRAIVEMEIAEINNNPECATLLRYLQAIENVLGGEGVNRYLHVKGNTVNVHCDSETITIVAPDWKKQRKVIRDSYSRNPANSIPKLLAKPTKTRYAVTMSVPRKIVQIIADALAVATGASAIGTATAALVPGDNHKAAAAHGTAIVQELGADVFKIRKDETINVQSVIDLFNMNPAWDVFKDGEVFHGCASAVWDLFGLGTYEDNDMGARAVATGAAMFNQLYNQNQKMFVAETPKVTSEDGTEETTTEGKIVYYQFDKDGKLVECTKDEMTAYWGDKLGEGWLADMLVAAYEAQGNVVNNEHGGGFKNNDEIEAEKTKSENEEKGQKLEALSKVVGEAVGDYLIVGNEVYALGADGTYVYLLDATIPDQIPEDKTESEAFAEAFAGAGIKETYFTLGYAIEAELGIPEGEGYATAVKLGLCKEGGQVMFKTKYHPGEGYDITAISIREGQKEEIELPTYNGKYATGAAITALIEMQGNGTGVQCESGNYTKVSETVAEK